jgi:N-acetylmuramoyl-L-alanine amidase
MSGIYRAARQRILPCNWSAGSSEPNRLDITHVMQGSLWGTDSWFHNRAAQASSHFGVGYDGTILQWVDCNQMAWHACNANGHSIGVETEGLSGQPFTDRQIRALAAIMHWANGEYPQISMWLNARPFTGSGLSYHGLGGASWCGHPSCPGTPRIRQLERVISLAKSL